MRNVRVDVLYCLVVAVIFLAPFARASGGVSMTDQKPCNIHEALPQCGQNERCDQNLKDAEARCICQRGYERIEGVCTQEATTAIVSVTTVQPDLKSDTGGSSVADLLIPTFLVVICVLLYFGARRYKWLQRFRQFRQNRYGNVLVTRDDDDDDDPPIA